MPRLTTWLSDYGGAEDTELNREFGAKFLIAGVRRVKKPGTKFDQMLVLEGKQGTGKSSLAEALAVRSEWFCGSLDLNADAKTQAELLRHAWVVECQELDGARKATLDAVKKFLATSADSYRPAYARNAARFPRHCIIIGTTNENKYLRDPTGNRRFWPVETGEINLERFRADVGQLWAEAATREAEGESIVLSQELWEAAAVLQRVRMVEDPIAVVLEDALAEKTGQISMESVKLLLGFRGGRLSTGEAQRVKTVMKRLGWDYNTYRLHALGETVRTPRKGFAHSDETGRKSEWIAVRVENGVVTLCEVEDLPGDREMPF